LTFCNHEPAVIGICFDYIIPNEKRGLLLLLDQLVYGPAEGAEDRISVAWNIHHDIYLGASTLEIIADRCEGLLALSQSMDIWKTSRLGKRFHFVNVETLQAGRKIWKQCLEYATSPTTYRHHLNNVVQTASIFAKHWRVPANGPLEVPLPRLSASFGLSVMKSEKVILHYMKQYWAKGVVDPNDVPSERFLNPLFLSTRSWGDKFVIDRNLSPLSIFHLREAGENIETRRIFDGVPQREINLGKVVASAKSQFRDWCLAFCDFVGRAEQDSEPSAKMVIRFAVADPISFCMALQ
jgi:hypothetical protein